MNGQKGIQNNISVDGADFNNPFFGEQRGGQRPAFTFNMDAIKEVVVVAEGANAEFGRSNGGFVNVVTKSGTNDIHGTAHLYYKNDGLSSAPKRADGTSADKFDFSAVPDRLHARRALEEGQGLLLPGPRLPGRHVDEADRLLAHRAAGRELLREPGQPQRERSRSSAPTTPGCSWARSTTS